MAGSTSRPVWQLPRQLLRLAQPPSAEPSLGRRTAPQVQTSCRLYAGLTTALEQLRPRASMLSVKTVLVTYLIAAGVAQLPVPV